MNVKQRFERFKISVRRENNERFFRKMRSLTTNLTSFIENKTDPHIFFSEFASKLQALSANNLESKQVAEFCEFLKQNLYFIKESEENFVLQELNSLFSLENFLSQILYANNFPLEIGFEFLVYLTFLFDGKISTALFLELLKRLNDPGLRYRALNSLLVVLNNLLNEQPELLDLLFEPFWMTEVNLKLGQLSRNNDISCIEILLKSIESYFLLRQSTKSLAFQIGPCFYLLGEFKSQLLEIFLSGKENARSLTILSLLAPKNPALFPNGNFMSEEACQKFFSVYSDELFYEAAKLAWIVGINEICSMIASPEIDRLVKQNIAQTIRRLSRLISQERGKLQISAIGLSANFLIDFSADCLVLPAIKNEGILEAIVSVFAQVENFEVANACCVFLINYYQLDLLEEKRNNKEELNPEEKKILEVIFACLKKLDFLDFYLILSLLNLLKFLLLKGENLASEKLWRKNPFVTEILGNEYCFILENLQQDKRNEVYALSRQIIDQFFENEEN